MRIEIDDLTASLHGLALEARAAEATQARRLAKIEARHRKAAERAGDMVSAAVNAYEAVAGQLDRDIFAACVVREGDVVFLQWPDPVNDTDEEHNG